MIIGITGYCCDSNDVRRVAGAGKDAAADRLVKNHNFVKVGLADPLKRICQEVYDFSDAQLWGPSHMREAPDFRYPRGAQQWRDAYHSEMEHARTASDAGQVKEAAEYLRCAAGYGAEGWLTPRYALQQLGTEWGRRCFSNTWINYGLRIAKQLETGIYDYSQKAGLTLRDGRLKPIAGVVFSDIRFFNEHAAIVSAGGKVVRVKRSMNQLFPMGTDNQHQSERELSEWQDERFDYVISNNGSLDDLILLTDRMYDVFSGRIIPYDEEQADVPPALRK